MSTTTIQPPIMGVAQSDDEAAWHEQRRQGITATEVRDAAKGNSTDRRRIIADKVSGNWKDLSGNRYVAWGNEREPHVAALMEAKYGLTPNGRVMARAANPRHLATPDGYEDNAILGTRTIGEYKTSKHDLDPFAGEPGPESGLSVVRPIHRERAERAKGRGEQVPYFWATGYYDQCQFQMLVTGAESCLFAWEQHDNEWPNPNPYPVRVAVVEADPERQAYLEKVADDLLADIDAARVGTLSLDLGDIPADIADAVHKVLEYRNAEAVAAEGKAAAWAEVTKYLDANASDDEQYENSAAKVSWKVTAPTSVTGYATDDMTTSQREAHTKRVASVERAQAAVDKAQEALKAAKARLTKAQDAVESKSARWAIWEDGERKGRLTITAKRNEGDK